MLPVLVLVGVAASFVLSAAAGMGGSLLLVPVLGLVLGPKEGVALAALLLATNNVLKIIVYRPSLPWRAAAGIALVVALGAAIGARLLAAVPEDVVSLAVIASIALTFLAERLREVLLRRVGAPLLAAGAGITSGFSGTSGPLKGVALRSLDLDRFHLVGAASLVSLTGDASKVLVYANESLLDRGSLALALAALPLMIVCTLIGRRVNRAVGERGFAVVFWGVMGGYVVRLLLP